MAAPLLLPLVVGGVMLANYMKGKATGDLMRARQATKETASSEKAFFKVADDLATGVENGKINPAIAQRTLESMHDTAGMYENGPLTIQSHIGRVQGAALHQQSMQGIISALFGQGQEGVSPMTSGGTPGPSTLTGPPAPLTTPQQDLPVVSRQIADINQTPTLQRTPQQVEQRGQLINEESSLTDKALAPDFRAAIESSAPQNLGNLPQAQRDLNLTPQEANLYRRHLSNLNGPGKVQNADGSISTLYQMSIERNGRVYNIPSVYNGQMLSPDEAVQRAEQIGLDTFPSYRSTGAAETRYQKMHNYMEKDTQAFQAANTPMTTFPKLPGILKMGGMTSVTIPKDMFGVEIHGTRDEALNGVIGQARSHGFSNGEIYDHLKGQGINPPETLAHAAFNEFAGKFLTSEQFMKSPRLALQEIAARFPTTDPKALTTFGQQAFQAAYIGAKQRLRGTGQFVSDRQISQAAFNEATASVGSEFVNDTVLQDLDRAKASTTDNLMVELLDKAMTGDKGAMQQYNTLLQMHAGKIGAEEASRRIAGIKAEQATAMMPADNLKDLQSGGQPLPFGTTQQQAAGSQVITPEQQAVRTQRGAETDKMKFVAERALPVMQGAQTRALALVDQVNSTGLLGKASALAGLPSKLGQELKGYDDYRVKFIGNLRSLAGETAGVITDKDIDRFASLFPEGKDFVTLMVDRHEQLIKNFSEMEAVLSDRLGQPVHPFKDIIGKLQTMGKSKDTFGKTLDDFEKAMKGTKKK